MGDSMHRYQPAISVASRCFLRAAGYPAPRRFGVFREPRPHRRFPWSERHLQCVWFDPALRPACLRAASGERIVVENPGVWNLEAGPDFLGAVVRVEPDRRRLAGDVEVHVSPGDWHAHGHDNDPRYANVRFHVTSFPGAGGPAFALHIPLNDVLVEHLRGDLDFIDVTAYPYAARTAAPPCAAEFARWNADRIQQFLDAAGEERLRRKSDRLAAQMEMAGADQTFYAESLASLGYKYNKAPCRRLAEAVPLSLLREEAQGSPTRAYALLAGVAGLLPAADSSRWDAETRAWLRELWDFWWRRRDRFENNIIPRSAWRVAGQRPANHPARRLMAAALFFAQTNASADYWIRAAETSPSRVCDLFAQAWLSLRDPYFSMRCCFGGKPLKHPASLIGRERAEAMAVNVLAPFLAAAGAEKAFAGGLLEHMPPAEENSLIRQTAYTLLGADHPPSLYRAGLRRQGLLQIFHDYCLNDRSRCAACPLPSLLRNAAGASGARGEPFRL